MSKELRNSLWCTDKAGKVGMIDEINSGVVSFRYADADGKLGDVVPTDIADLKIATAAQLPKSHGLTAEQLVDLGYAEASQAAPAPSRASPPTPKPAADSSS